MTMAEALAWLSGYVAAGYAAHYGLLWVTDRWLETKITSLLDRAKDVRLRGEVLRIKQQALRRRG